MARSPKTTKNTTSRWCFRKVQDRPTQDKATHKEEMSRCEVPRAASWRRRRQRRRRRRRGSSGGSGKSGSRCCAGGRRHSHKHSRRAAGAQGGENYLGLYSSDSSSKIIRDRFFFTMPFFSANFSHFVWATFCGTCATEKISSADRKVRMAKTET